MKLLSLTTLLALTLPLAAQVRLIPSQTKSEAPEADWQLYALDPNDTTDHATGSDFKIDLLDLPLTTAAIAAFVPQLADPDEDRLRFWDDSAGAEAWLTLGTGLSITGTTINSTGAVDESADYTWTGAHTFSSMSVTTLATGSLQFEGATADDHETILTVTDPTADRTWTLPDVSDTVVGLAATQTLTNKTLTSPVFTEAAVAASDIDWATATTFTKTLSANTTFTFSNVVNGKTINVAVTNTASNYTVTWPTVSWSGGTPPTQTVGAKTDIYTFIRINGVVYGSVVQNF